jgi:hypothetical protein
MPVAGWVAQGRGMYMCGDGASATWAAVYDVFPDVSVGLASATSTQDTFSLIITPTDYLRFVTQHNQQVRSNGSSNNRQVRSNTAL